MEASQSKLMRLIGDERSKLSGAGLCANCLHARLIESDKGSAFLQCHLSFTDPRFKKYPPLPVVNCSGYLPASN